MPLLFFYFVLFIPRGAFPQPVATVLRSHSEQPEAEADLLQGESWLAFFGEFFSFLGALLPL